MTLQTIRVQDQVRLSPRNPKHLRQHNVRKAEHQAANHIIGPQAARIHRELLGARLRRNHLPHDVEEPVGRHIVAASRQVWSQSEARRRSHASIRRGRTPYNRDIARRRRRNFIKHATPRNHEPQRQRQPAGKSHQRSPADSLASAADATTSATVTLPDPASRKNTPAFACPNVSRSALATFACRCAVARSTLDVGQRRVWCTTWHWMPTTVTFSPAEGFATDRTVGRVCPNSRLHIATVAAVGARVKPAQPCGRSRRPGRVTRPCGYIARRPATAW